MTTNEAKNDIQLKKHFTAEPYDLVDKQIKSLVTEYGISEEDAKDILSDSVKTTDRVKILTDRLIKLEAKKFEATGKKKDEYAAQINELNGQITKLKSDAKADMDTAIKNLNAEWESKLSNREQDYILGGKKYANDKVPQDVNVITAKTIINQELAKKGAVAIYKDGKFHVKQIADTSLDFKDKDGSMPDFNTLADGILAASGLLQVSGSQGGSGGTGAGQGGSGKAPVIPGGSGNPIQRNSFQAALDKNIADLTPAV